MIPHAGLLDVRYFDEIGVVKAYANEGQPEEARILMEKLWCVPCIAAQAGELSATVVATIIAGQALYRFCSTKRFLWPAAKTSRSRREWVGVPPNTSHWILVGDRRLVAD